MKGILEDIGIHQLGHAHYRYYRCKDCGTEYPRLQPYGMPSCNGKIIGRCPYCQEKAMINEGDTGRYFFNRKDEMLMVLSTEVAGDKPVLVVRVDKNYKPKGSATTYLVGNHGRFYISNVEDNYDVARPVFKSGMCIVHNTTGMLIRLLRYDPDHHKWWMSDMNDPYKICHLVSEEELLTKYDWNDTKQKAEKENEMKLGYNDVQRHYRSEEGNIYRVLDVSQYKGARAGLIVQVDPVTGALIGNYIVHYCGMAGKFNGGSKSLVEPVFTNNQVLQHKTLKDCAPVTLRAYNGKTHNWTVDCINPEIKELSEKVLLQHYEDTAADGALIEVGQVWKDKSSGQEDMIVSVNRKQNLAAIGTFSSVSFAQIQKNWVLVSAGCSCKGDKDEVQKQ